MISNIESGANLNYSQELQEQAATEAKRGLRVKLGDPVFKKLIDDIDGLKDRVRKSEEVPAQVEMMNLNPRVYKGQMLDLLKESLSIPKDPSFVRGGEVGKSRIELYKGANDWGLEIFYDKDGNTSSLEVFYPYGTRQYQYDPKLDSNNQ